MVRQVLVLLFAIAIRANSSAIQNVGVEDNIINPYDLADNATAQIQVLREVILDSIIAAHDIIDSLGSDSAIFTNDTVLRAELEIELQYQQIDSELDTLKNLGLQAGQDISDCIDVPGEILDKLPDVYTGELELCILGTNRQGTYIANEGKYRVDITITRVNALDFQLGQCAADDTDCVQAILDQIETDGDELPRGIEDEVGGVTILFGQLRGSIQNCSDTTVGGYAGASVGMLLNISNCVNGLLGL